MFRGILICSLGILLVLSVLHFVHFVHHILSLSDLSTSPPVEPVEPVEHVEPEPLPPLKLAKRAPRPFTPSRSPPSTPSTSSPFLVILFLVRTGFIHPEIWGSWTLDAFKRYDDPQRLPVSFVIHHDVDADPVAIWNQLPPSMQQITKFASPAKCEWLFVNPCMERALKTGLEAFPTTQSFVYASFDAVPVKTFHHIHNSLLDNPRSRILISNLNFPHAPKHQQWIMLKRKHAEMLVQNPGLWADKNVCRFRFFTFSNGRKKGAGPDEFCPLRALEILSRNSSAVASDYLIQNDHPLFGYTHEESLWKDINLGFIPPLARDVGTNTEWEHSMPTTYLCWTECEQMGHFIGRLPRCYDSVKSEAFESKLLGEQYWFARKFTPNCTVELSPNESGERKPVLLRDWLPEKLLLQF